MIHKLSFSNLYSFEEEQVVDFTVNEHAPQTETYVDSPFGVRVGKVLVLLGHNASGKTNLLKAFGFLRWLLAHSFGAPLDEAIPFRPHFLARPKTPASLSTEFELDERLYRYSVRVVRERLLREQLEEKSSGSKGFGRLVTREWNEGTQRYEVDYARKYGDKTVFRLPDSLEAPRKRKNASIITIGAQVGEPLSEAISEFWKNVRTNVSEAGRVIPSFQLLLDATSHFLKSPRHFEKAKGLLRQCDLGLDDITLKEVEASLDGGDTAKVYYPFGVHRRDEKAHELFFAHESGGTNALFMLLSDLLRALESGTLAVLDEFDTDLHPLMTPKLIDMLVGRVTNPRNAQLICSCHTPTVLNGLDKYQILLVEKDADLRSSVWRLDEMGVRADDNFFAKYMAGTYGAVPDF